MVEAVKRRGRVLLVAACSGGAPTATLVPTNTPAPPTATPEPAAKTDDAMMMAAPEDAVLIALNELHGSGQTGWAMLTAKSAETEATLHLHLGAVESELVHIHTGSCGDNLGGVASPLTSFEAGSGVSMTRGEASSESLLTGDFAINSHKAGEPAVYTTCGNIPAGDAMAGSEAASTIRNFTLENLTVAVGTTITWTNLDRAPHTSTSGTSPDPDGDWDSSNLSTDASFNRTFDTAGAFAYFCTIHPNVIATITVTEDGRAAMSSGGDAMAAAEVSSDTQNFTLENLTVAVGTTIAWMNQDGAPHTSTSG